MTDVRVLVVDDEPLARAGLRAILREEHDLSVVGESGSGADAIAAIEALAPDLVFLDIALAGHRRVRCHRAHAARASAGHRVRDGAFGSGAAGVRDARAGLRDEADSPRARARGGGPRSRAHPPRATRPATVASPGCRRTARWRSSIDGRVQLIDPQSIDWVAADDDHVRVHCGERVWRARDTLREIARRLDPGRFVQIHRSTVVRLGAIRELQPWFHGDYVAILHSGAKLRLEPELPRRRRDHARRGDHEHPLSFRAERGILAPCCRAVSRPRRQGFLGCARNDAC